MSQPIQQQSDNKNKENTKKKAPIPKKSSSVIICRKKQQEIGEDRFDYEILMLRRNIKLSFGGMHSFPGGNMDKEDLIFTQTKSQTHKNNTQLRHQWQDALIYTCARELFEEIGFFIAKKSQEQLIIDISQNDKLNFSELFSAIQPDLRSFFTPFLRVITIQTLPRRWDTQFFVVQVDEAALKSAENDGHCLYNILKYQETKRREDLFNTNDLVINRDESDMYSWESPITALRKHAEKEIKLPIPQVLICNLMSSLEQTTSLQNYLQQIEQQHHSFSKLPQIDYLRQNPATFPFILDIKQLQNKKLRLIMYGDEEYPVQKILDTEEESEFKEELRSAFGNVQVNKGQFLRLETDYQTHIITNIKCNFLAPFTLLRTINLQNVQNLPLKPKL